MKAWAPKEQWLITHFNTLFLWKVKTWVKNSAQNEVILSFNENVRNMKCLPNDTGKRPTNESTHSSSNYRNLETWKTTKQSHII